METQKEKAFLVKKFPEPLYIRFKSVCIQRRLTIKQALIEAMDLWICKQKQQV